jgi:predicted ArsR family transcriptional regulator
VGADPAPDATVAAIERLVGALQDPTRRSILLSFYEDPGPHGVDDVAAVAGVHRTVAFSHLERLAAGGFLDTSQRRGGPGKPAKLYRLVAGPLELHHPARQFATLAGLLAAGLAGFGSSGVDAAREAGRRHGSTLAGGTTTSPAQALLPLVLLGGEYAVEGDTVLVRNCIFREACGSAPQIVCHLHAGMIEGALEAAGFNCTVEPNGDETSQATCAYHLTRLGGD